jgi:hypothetical protein
VYMNDWWTSTGSCDESSPTKASTRTPPATP